MEQFSVPADDLVERLESKMFELSNGKVGPGSAVSSQHIEAVRQQLVKKRKQEEQFDPTVDEFLEMQREDKQVRAQRQREFRYNKMRNDRLRNERIRFEENCLLRTYPSIKSAVWVQAISHASNLQVTFPMVTVVVKVVRKLSNSFWPVSVLRKFLCMN